MARCALQHNCAALTAATKTWTATYLPFGEIRTTTGTPIALRFPGQWFQSESGLHQNWMRDYDPTTGRYLEADPLGLVDGASIYGYAKGNPGKWVDPSGKFIPVLVWFVGSLIIDRIADLVEENCGCESSGSDILAILTAASMADGFGMGKGKPFVTPGSATDSSYQSYCLSKLGIRSSVRIPTPSGIG